MKAKHLISMVALGAALATPVSAVELTVSITNLTQGMHFTPRLLVAHNNSVDLFEAGEAASTPLAWLAEGGVIEGAANPRDFGSYLENVSRSSDNA